MSGFIHQIAVGDIALGLIFIAPLLLIVAIMVRLQDGQSAIFSHTRYYGRTAYVVPKAALNALSQELAKFGAHAFLSDPHRMVTFGGKPLSPAEVESPYIIRVAIALLMLARRGAWAAEALSAL